MKPRNKRKDGRVYALKPTSILLKNRMLRVSDISNEGIGIVLDDHGPQFVTGERLENIPIPLDSGTVSLKGIVSHISVTAERKICGIRFDFGGTDFSVAVKFKRERTLPSQE